MTSKELARTVLRLMNEDVLMESVETSYMEKCIAIAYNGGYARSVEKKLPTFGIAEEIYEHYQKPSKLIAADIKKVIGADLGVMIHFGAGVGKMAGWWVGNPTPRTDDYFTGARVVNISLKKQGGSQLMSARADETLSTFRAATESMGTNAPQEAIDLVTLLKPALQKIIIQGNIETMKKVIAQGLTIPKTISAPREKGGPLHRVKIDPKAYAKEMGKFIKWKESMKEGTSLVKKFFEDNQEFKKWFAFEAATGLTKFGPDPHAWSNWVVSYNMGGTGNHIESLMDENRQPSPYMINLAKAVSVRIAPKSGSGSNINALGRAVTDTSFRMDMPNETVSEWCEARTSEFSRSLMLTEGFLTEDNILSMAWNWLKNLATALVQKLYDIASQGLAYLLHFLEFEPASVQVSGLELYGY